MRTIAGTGCWPGRAEGPIVWLNPERHRKRSPTLDRLGEVMRFRAEVGRALADLEGWSEQQATVEGRLLFLGYREALLEDAWTARVTACIDGEGATAAVAALEVALQISAVMARSDALTERAEQMRAVGQWMADRLDPLPLPPGAIVAGTRLPPLAVVDRQCPAVTGGPEPPVTGGGPLVWGVREIGPHWHGRRVAIDGQRITLDLPDPRWWALDGNQLNGLPICYLNGNPGAVRRMAHKLGRRPVAMLQRLDDLAAAPLLAGEAAALALDLDRLGPAPRLKHPGVRMLLDAAVAAARRASIPLVAGGEPARKEPDLWLSLGCTALFGEAGSRGGRIDAVRRGKESGL